MTCSCPKCDEQITLDSSDIPSEGSFNKCSACSTSFVVNKGSFACRALHKGDTISCAECGSNPGASIYCQHCHVMYPDFLFIETSSPMKRKISKILSSLNALKNFKLGGTTKVYGNSYSGEPFSQGQAKAVNSTARPAQLLVVVAVIIALLAGGGYYWYQDKLAAKYTENYIKALLGVKMARDLDLKFSSRLSVDMKTGASPILTAIEQKAAVSAKNDVDTLMKRIDNVPAKFTASQNSLTRLYDSYSKLHTAVTSPAGSSDQFSTSINNIDADFKNNARELKSGLPEKISTQLSITSKKFKALQDL